MTQPTSHDEDRIERQLLELEDNPQAAHETTVCNLHKELETLAHDLKAPAPKDPHEDESACQRAVEQVQTLAGGQTVPSKPDLGSHSDLKPMAVIGQYQILGKIGQGGMGAVYKALHTKLEKVVALKVLPEDRLDKPDALARFEREMKAVGKIEHPHLVRALDAGEADGSHYLVMEFVDGIDLSRLLKEQGQLPVAAACELVRQAALGLQAAHQSGMIHRDIKPANLMLARQDYGPPVVKVLDLGLARLSDESSPSETDLTTDNQIMGTLDFMAPEQAGNSRGVDTRVDVYSLGATLFTLLSGQPPYHSLEHQTIVQKLNALANTPLPNLRNVRPDVPQGLAQVLEKMLAKDREKRYREPGDVAEALKPYVQNADLAGLLEDAKTLSSASHSSRSTASWAIPSTDATIGLKKPPRSRWAIAALLLLVLAPLLILYAGTIIRFATNQGELVIEIDDPNIEVQVVQNGVIVKDKTKDREFTLTAANGEIEVFEKDGVKLITKDFQLNRGGKTIVQITLIKPEQPADMNPPKTDDPASPSDPDRQAADWIVRRGNSFECFDAQRKYHEVRRVDKIPSSKFKITVVSLYDTPPPTEAQFKSLKDLENLNRLEIGTPMSREVLKELPQFRALQMLHLSGPSSQNLNMRGIDFTDQDLEILRLMPRLARLDLAHSAKITDQSGPHLEHLKNLTSLGLNNVPVSDEILQHVVKLKTLNTLSLSDTAITDEGIRSLGGLPQLQDLHLHGTAITNQAGPYLEQLKALKVLHLEATKIDEGILRHLAKLESLEFLNLAWTTIGDKGLAILHDISSLKSICLAYTKVTEAGIATLLQSPQLQHLDLRGLLLTDAVVPTLAQQKQLTSVDLSGTKITADGIAKLHSALTDCRITWEGGVLEPKSSDPDRQAAEWVLSVGGRVYLDDLEFVFEKREHLPKKPFRLTGVDMSGGLKLADDPKSIAAGFANFQGVTQLSKLVLSDLPVTDEALSPFSNCQELKHLDLVRTKITDEGLAYFSDCKNLRALILYGMPKLTNAGLAHFQGCDHLEVLVLGTCGAITDAGLIHFKDCRNLKELHLQSTSTTDSGLALFKNCTDLTTLSNSQNITDAGLAHIKDFKKIKSLTLGNSITDQGLAMLANFNELVELHMYHSQITEAGLAHLKNFPQLGKLELAGEGITDAGLLHLKDHKHLYFLNLSETPITDTGLKHLHGLTSLRSLILLDTKVTMEGVALLQTTLPECYVALDERLKRAPGKSANPE